MDIFIVIGLLLIGIALTMQSVQNAAQKQLNTHLVNALSKVIDRIKELDKPIVIKRRRR